MAQERTLSILKPDATRRNLTGRINAKFEAAGLAVIASRRLQLTQAQAEAFYAVHAQRPFFKDLVSFMISGPVVAQVLAGEKRDRQKPRHHGCHRSQKSRARHHPRGIRRIHRSQLRPTAPTAPKPPPKKSATSSPE